MQMRPSDPLRKSDEEIRRSQAWWGIAGLILVIAFIGISAVLSGPLAESTLRFVPGIGPDMWQIFVGAAVFVALLSISGIIYSLFAPKKKDLFSERELNKERKLIWAEEKAKKERQKEMRRQIAKARRENKQSGS